MILIFSLRYAFRGHCSFRQYIPSKPNPYGLKYYNCCDAKTGYLCDSIPYLGKSESNDGNTTEIGRKMVESLTSYLWNTNRCVCNNFKFPYLNI